MCGRPMCLLRLPVLKMKYMSICLSNLCAVWFIYKVIRAVTINQTHDSVRIMIFDPRFGSYHDFFVGGGRKKKRFLKQYFLLNNI